LEHRTIPFAIREPIANALDEQALTGTAEPAIFKDEDPRWHVADNGRGLRYEHLTQQEDAEKRKHAAVIGRPLTSGLTGSRLILEPRGHRCPRASTGV